MHFLISLHLKNGKPFASAYWRIGLKYASALNILLVFKFAGLYPGCQAASLGWSSAVCQPRHHCADLLIYRLRAILKRTFLN